MTGLFGYIDVCSGLSAPTLAWKPLGWRPLCYSEIEAAPRALLRHRYPDVPLHGDFTKLRGDEHGPVDLLVGGTPCQDYSVAGLRAGLDGSRGNLTFEFSRLAYRARTRWLVWENVPGVFSSNGGRDFGAILATFSGRHGLIFSPPPGGWRNSGIVEPHGPDSFGLAWRVLDAQYFGVPQRRRRVFLVGYLGDWRRAAAVLLERAGLQGNPAPRREKGQATSGTLAARAGGGGWPDGGDGRHDQLIAHSLRADGFDASEDGTGRGTPLVPVAIQDCSGRDKRQNGRGWNDDDTAYTLDAAATQAVCFTAKDHSSDASDISPTLRSGSHSGSHANGGVMPAVAFQSSQSGVREVDAHATLDSNNGSRRHNGVVQGSAVRRLTPRECERLQGIPDDFTLVPYRNGLMADGPRYKMIGNSWAVPCGTWLGERIQFVESMA